MPGQSRRFFLFLFALRNPGRVNEFLYLHIPWTPPRRSLRYGFVAALKPKQRDAWEERAVKLNGVVLPYYPIMQFALFRCDALHCSGDVLHAFPMSATGPSKIGCVLNAWKKAVQV
jgi:hypothetical protein